jgi:hypothetical protein
VKSRNIYERTESGLPALTIAFPVLLIIISLAFFLCRPAKALAAIESGYGLIGTIESRNFTGAVIRVDNEQQFFRLGDKLPDGSRIVEVGADTILVKATDGTTHEMFVVHEVRAASPYNPYATGREIIRTPGKHVIDSYARKLQSRLGDRFNDQ